MSLPPVAPLFDFTLLKHLLPIRDLQVENRQTLANKSHLVELQPGEELMAADQHRWMLYLLSGKMDLRSSKHTSVLFGSGDQRACHPVFAEGEHKCYAVAQTPCKVIRFDRQLFNTLLDYEFISGTEMTAIETDDGESHLFNAIMQAFNAGNLQLPSLPDIALKVKNAAANPDVSIDDVSHIVEADPTIAARLIQVASSAGYRGLTPVRSIRDAIMRIGLVATRNLVIGLSMKQLFKTENPMLLDRMHELYEHSVEVAAISFALGHRAKHAQEDYLLLAGLVHDIGVIPILAYIDSTGLVVESPSDLESIINKLRGVVGSMVIRHWEMPAELVTVVEDAENWQRNAGEKLDICDMVVIAQIYSMLQRHQLQNLPKFEEVPAFHKLFKGKPDAEFAKQVLLDAHEEVVEVMRLLKI
jgi:HD-like signal output (HDOD) protein